MVLLLSAFVVPIVWIGKYMDLAIETSVDDQTYDRIFDILSGLPYLKNVTQDKPFIRFEARDRDVMSAVRLEIKRVTENWNNIAASSQ